MNMHDSPSWPYEITASIVAALRRIDFGLGVVSQAPLLPQLRQRLEKESRRRASRASAGIEGVTIPDAAFAALDSGAVPTGRNEREVAALVHMYDWIAQQPPSCQIGETDCRQLHRMVWRRVLAASMTGRYRNDPVYVWDGAVPIYEAPSASDVPTLMHRFGRWLESLAMAALHPALAAGIAQYEFVRIHPFMDGNGRSSRGLSALILRSFDADAHGLLAQEQQMLDQLQEFYRAIDASNKRQRLEPWLEFYCLTLADEVERVVREIATSPVVTAVFPGARLNQRQHVYLRLLQQDGELRAARAMQETGTSQATFFRDMQELVRLGLVSPEGTTRGRVYRFMRPADAR